MSKLLLNELPLIVLPSLAKAVGLNESIILQQIHYWLTKKLHFYHGKYWTYNSYEKWRDQFPFFTARQLRYAIKHLEKKGVLISGNFNKSSIDRTKWYSINYEKLESFYPLDKIVQSFDTNVQSSDTIVKPIPKTTTETTTKSKKTISLEMEEILNYGT